MFKFVLRNRINILRFDRIVCCKLQKEFLTITKELGPYFVDPNNSSRLLRNPFSWTEVAHVIFIDQPVGVGLSFVEQSEGYVRNQYELSAQLHNALVQFFEMHPEYKNLDLYLTGESYAGLENTL